MKRILSIAAVTAAAVAVALAKGGAKDPVLMTVGGHDVKLSEFEYLYHKNNQQQLQPQSIDDYLKMFVDYKLKVADAEAARLDTSATFRAELDKYTAELAAPYMVDSTVYDRLVREAYANTHDDVDVSHIMMFVGRNKHDNDSIQQALAQLRQDILDGKISWDDAVVKHSIDRGTNQRQGRMGWMVAGAYPWPFEEMAYKTAVGEISPVVNSGYYNHIIRVNGRRPAVGEVHARHILRMTRGKSADEAAKAKEQIDSIYNVLVAGGDFETLAKQHSEDPGSGAKGGDLGWFGPGRMVAQFDSVSFAIKDGEISRPFATAFGWHIVQRLESKGPKSLDEARPQIMAQINNDDRGMLPFSERMAVLRAKHKTALDNKGLDAVEQLIRDNGGYDSTAIAKLQQSDIVIGHVGKTPVYVKEVMGNVPTTASTDIANIRTLIAGAANSILDQVTGAAERAVLIDEQPSYRNLVREYRDGILLFDISSQRVWDKAAKDTAGLEEFFRANRAKYNWAAPKYKGYIVFATNDSVMGHVQQFCDSIDAAHAFNPQTIGQDLRKRFGRDVRIERVLAAKGDNPISDYLAFGGPKPADNPKMHLKSYIKYQGRVIDQPENAADVRGAVVTDYQNALEQEWLKELHAKYPVKINQKVLKKAK